MNSDQFQESIGKTLTAIRKDLGLSQAEFGKIISKTSATIGLWESGQGSPDIFSFYLIAKNYDYSLDALFDGELQKDSDDSDNIYLPLFAKIQALPESSLEFLELIINRELDKNTSWETVSDWVAQNNASKSVDSFDCTSEPEDM